MTTPFSGQPDGQASVAAPPHGGAPVQPLANRRVLRFIAEFWARRPVLASVGTLMTLLGVAFDLALPWASGRLIDAIAANPPQPPHIWRAWLAFIGVYIAFTLIRNTTMRVWVPIAARNMQEITTESFARVQSFSAAWHARTHAGATVRRLSRGVWGYDAVTDAFTIWLVPGSLVLIGMTIMLALREPVAGLVALGVALGYLTINLVLTVRYVRPANLQSNALDAQVNGAIADALAANTTVKLFAQEAAEIARVQTLATTWRVAISRTWRRFLNLALGQNLLLVVLQAGLTGAMVYACTTSLASPGDVVFAITAFMIMSNYLRNMGDNIRSLQKGIDDTEDVAAFARQVPDVRDAPAARALQPLGGTIQFRDVAFRYPSSPSWLFRHLDFAVSPGERVAVVGPSGAGKSSLVRLLLRLYDVQGGQILVDGQDIAQVTQSSLRAAIAVVPQEPGLFHRSIYDNIAYARPDARRDEVIAAACRARAHDFVSKLEKGYDTLVGEGGVKLSGGERQRIAIARAFLSNAPIVVLDEATSALDVGTEALVQAALEDLMAQRTVIIIAHRLSTIRHCDRILVMEGGRIVEEGDHATLLRRGGHYAHAHAESDPMGNTTEWKAPALA